MSVYAWGPIRLMCNQPSAPDSSSVNDKSAADFERQIREANEIVMCPAVRSMTPIKYEPPPENAAESRPARRIGGYFARFGVAEWRLHKIHAEPLLKRVG